MNDVAIAPARPATVLTRAGRTPGNRWQQSYLPVINEPGELVWIDKHHLRIDPQYQRRLWVDRVTRMAANWSWISCGTLLVSQRTDDASYYMIIDGQHRWEAAKQLPRVRQLPCIKFRLEEVRDEAVGFLAANTERKVPSLADQFNALLTTGSEEAQIANELVRSVGRQISSHPSGTNISAVAELLRFIKMDRAATERCWLTLAQLCEGRKMTKRMMRGVISLERVMPRRKSLGDAPWSTRLIHVGYDRVNDTIRQMSSVNANAGDRTCAEGVEKAINRNLAQKNQLVPVWK